jgi:hypothetical protein
MAELSPDQLFAFASTIAMHHALGAAIAKTSVLETVKRDFMKRGLLADQPAEADVGLGLLYALQLQAGVDGDAWVRAPWRQAIAESWGERAEVRIVQNLPPTSTTWAEIEMRSSDLAAAYWRTLSAYRIPDDPLALEDWVKRARKLLAEAGRGEIGDSKIGEILSAAIPEPDRPWPPKPVRELIELARSRPLEQGFEVGVYNRRGVTVRMPQDGGGQERALAERYRHDAKALRFDWPRTAACVDRIATIYEVDASREDLSAEQRDWL